MRISKRIPEIVGLVALVFVGACDTLNIANPNDPDRRRALGDANSIPSIAQGAFQTWYLTSQGGFGEDQYPALTMSVMARSHVAMWNNYHIRYYTGCTTDWAAGGYPAGTCGNLTEGPAYPRAAWANSLAAAERTQIEAMWYGYYASLSSANDALTAIRTIGLDVPGAHMVETMSVLTQALALSGIALNYDQGFIVDYNTDLNSLTLSNRTQVRDAALAKFDEAITLAAADSFLVPGGDWFGGPAVEYTNVSVAQIANTMAARLLAYFPRNAAENATVDWARVAGYASKGISSGASPFNLTFHQDACTSWCDFLKVWSNDMTTMRVHTRVAHMMDPASQPDPWDVSLNHNPSSPDKRLGDGTSREPVAYDTLILRAYPDTNCKKPVGCTGGSDFVWTHTKEFGNKTRGAWHQSAVGQVRYDSLTTCGDNPQGASTGAGDAPMVLAAENDLIWAEALIRGPANLALAATLINHTRVGRGGLPAATAGDPNLLQELQYEQDVELIGSNIAPFYNQRRIDNLEPLTPHEMPVPAQELGVLKLCSGTCYTWGGSSPPNSSAAAPGSSAAVLMQRAPQIWTQMYQGRQASMRASRLLRSLQ